VLLVRELQHPHDTRHADRKTTDYRVVELQRLPVGAEEHLRRRRSRRGFAPVIAFEPMRRGVVMQQESAAADTGGLRLDQSQHHLHRDRRIDRTAAFAQDLAAGFDGERMRGGDDLLRGEGFCRPGRMDAWPPGTGGEQAQQAYDWDQCAEATGSHNMHLGAARG
jgi:hypothetical protein